MNIKDWGFEIKTMPSPPPRHGASADPPPIERVAQAPSRRAEAGGREFADWITKLESIDAALYLAVRIAISELKLNLRLAPWPDAIKAMGEDPPSTETPLEALARWKMLFFVHNEGLEYRWQESVTRGSSTGMIEREEFGRKIGIDAKLGYGSTSIAMSAEFSAVTGAEREISYSESRTVTREFLIPKETTCQAWQLVLQIDALGTVLNEERPFDLNLTFPRESAILVRKFEESQWLQPATLKESAV